MEVVTVTPEQMARVMDALLSEEDDNLKFKSLDELDEAQRAELREAEREEHAGDCDDYAVQQERY